jgi:hypothetical protein
MAQARHRLTEPRSSQPEGVAERTSLQLATMVRVATVRAPGGDSATPEGVLPRGRVRYGAKCPVESGSPSRERTMCRQFKTALRRSP